MKYLLLKPNFTEHPREALLIPFSPVNKFKIDKLIINNLLLIKSMINYLSLTYLPQCFKNLNSTSPTLILFAVHLS